MRFKKIVPFALFCSSIFITPNVIANSLISPTHLDKVTLFLQGAELQSSSNVKISKGENEILLTNIANQLNASSIHIHTSDKVMILSTSLVDQYLVKKENSPKLIELKNELQQLKLQEKTLNIKSTTTDTEISLLKNNKLAPMTSGESTFNNTKKIIAFIKENLAHALTEQQAIQQELSEIRTKILQYQSQIDLEQGTNQLATKAIKVKIYSNEERTLPISLSYVIEDAGWEPIYDVRVKNVQSPLLLSYKANVHQHSGLDWNDVDVTLSTTNPSEGITLPVMMPWNVSIVEENKQSRLMSAKMFVASQDQNINENSQLSDYIERTNAGLNSQFTIKLPFTIEGQSENNILTLQENNLPAKYHYVAIPKLDNRIFLQAEIEDWNKLSILPGKFNVFYAGDYVGEGFLDSGSINSNTKNAMSFSLGQDRQIMINRIQNLHETSKTSLIGNKITQTFAYTINVKNTKNISVDLTIYDQLPNIQNKEITLDDTDYREARYDKETGLLTWKINLKPNESKDIPFSFKISYPKEKESNIIGLLS